MYQALYRKWRPKTFDDVVGQQHVTDTLKRQVLLDRLSHAYLFTGTRGTGKTTCAKLLARAVNCENPVGGNPCGKCPACLGIENGSILDVLEIDAASNNSVDNVRALRDDAVYTPASVRKRVYIIDEVHMLSNSAFNALLKILEEPPEHLMFILATTELHKVPATILSRCQRYSFRRVSQEDICARLELIAKAEELELTHEAAEMLARMADGSLRDALSLLDQCSGGVIDRQRVTDAIGVADSDEICRMLQAIKARDGERVMELLDELYMNGRDVSSVLDRLCELYRDLLMTKLAPKGGSLLLRGGFTSDELRALGEGEDVSALLAGLDTLEEAISTLRSSSNRRIAAEVCLLRLCDYAPAPAIQAFANVYTPYAASPAPAPTAAPVTEPEPVPVVEPAPGPVPESEPEVEQKSKPEPAAAAPGNGKFEKTSLLALLKKELDGYIFTLLEDPSQADIGLEGNLVRITGKNPFAMSMLDSSDVRDIVAAAAEKLHGAACRVLVEEAKPEDSHGESKLDRLMSRFDIKYDD